MFRTIRRHAVAAGLCALGALAVTPLAADRDRDHERARRAVESGEALPLADILNRVRPELGGEVIDVSFERKGERWVYEFKVIGPAGRLAKVYVDAASAQIVKRKER